MSTRPEECGSCGRDHPSSKPCRPVKASRSVAFPQYRYTNEDGTPMLKCPACGADLTAEDSVSLHIAIGGRPQELSTRLDKNGVLEDVEDSVARGLHAGTSCLACGDHEEFESREGTPDEEVTPPTAEDPMLAFKLSKLEEILYRENAVIAAEDVPILLKCLCEEVNIPAPQRLEDEIRAAAVERGDEVDDDL